VFGSNGIVDSQVMVGSQWFSWCGYLINTMYVKSTKANARFITYLFLVLRVISALMDFMVKRNTQKSNRTDSA
jgi:hypothetical protein